MVLRHDGLQSRRRPSPKDGGEVRIQLLYALSGAMRGSQQNDIIRIRERRYWLDTL
jgi:hypothetical protein